MSAAKDLTKSESTDSTAAAESGAIIQFAKKSSQKDAVSAMTQQMKASLSNLGGVDNLRHTILTYVAEERYEKATDELSAYLDSKPQYPLFKERASRYVSYGVELIQAIRAKRSFPGWNALNMSKQKDLFEKAIEHFEDLKVTLTKIEVIEKEVRVEDVRSTVWVVQTVVYCTVALIGFLFLRELTGGIIPNANNVLESTTSQLVDLLFDKLGL